MARQKGSGGDLKSTLRNADIGVLARLVLDLCELSDDNNAFVEARLEATEDPLAPYKKRINAALYPDVFSRNPIQVGAARRAISEYKKAAGDVPGMLELMIHFVECGTACSADYGDLDEAFYSSLESMYDRFLKALEETDAQTKESWRSRASGVVDRARGIGWGYGDYVADRLGESYAD